MFKSIVIILLAVGLVAFGYFILTEPSESNTVHEQTNQTDPTEQSHEDGPAEEHSVEYTGVSFEPERLTVHKGDSVKFINKSNKEMWVASDVHPLHSDYPEFDSKKAVGPNETYTFTFENAGEWHFHGHLNPTAKGTVEVEE